MALRPIQTSDRDVQGDFPAGWRSSSSSQEDPGLLPRQLSGLLGERHVPGNRPDLSQIENLCVIVKEELSKMEPATSNTYP